ncbi:MAG: hypothetical protein OWU84_14180 [Firmicutes bacterium]|nr:hypothetical protein [Bacillota bacterium]
MTALLHPQWLTATIPPPSGPLRLTSAFLREEPLDWTTFSFDDAQEALEHLVHYQIRT